MKRSIPLAALAVCSALALVGTAVFAPRVPGLASAETPGVDLAHLRTSAQPTSMTLACPVGTVDPFSLDSTPALAAQWSWPGGGWSRRSSSDVAAGVTSEAVDGNLDAPQGFVLSGQGGGELRGLAATPCAAASTDQWIALGSTLLGEDLVLYLANPGATTSVVTVTALGPAGPVGDNPHQVSIPAGGTLRVFPSSWYADLDRLALHLRADGPGVAAWAQSSAMDGEVPLGATWAPSVAASSSVVIPGLPAGAQGGRVRLALPGTEDSEVRLSMVSPQGTKALGAGTLTLGAGTTLDVPLGAVPAQGGALLVDSDLPVVAQVVFDEAGAEWSAGAATWGVRTAVAPAQSVTSVQLPSGTSVVEQVTSVLSAEPMRASEVDTRSGVSDVELSLMLLAAPDQQMEAAQSGAVDGAQSQATAPVVATVSVGSTEYELHEGTLLVVPVPDAASSLQASAPVHAAVLISATTPTGVLHAVWPLGARSLTAQEGTVDLRE